MIRSVGVEPGPELVDAAALHYDALMATVGYEPRSRFVSDKLAESSDRCYAAAFTTQRVEDFDRNRGWFIDNEFAVADVADDDYGLWTRSVLADLADAHIETPIVCVDVSSINRVRLARLLEMVYHDDRFRGVTADFVYAPAEFKAASVVGGSIQSADAVTPFFAGWGDPSRPLAAMIGLGYEEGRALGVAEYLEPGLLWAFEPFGQDVQYDEENRKANEFLETAWPIPRVVRYRVDHPFDCFLRLESLVAGQLANARVVLVPLGPKIFALCSMLVALAHSPDVAVWRVTPGQNIKPVPHKASGNLIALRVTIGR